MGISYSQNQTQSQSKVLSSKQKIEWIITFMVRTHHSKIQPFPNDITVIIMELLYQSRFDRKPWYRSKKDAKDVSKRYDMKIVLYLAGDYDVGKTSLVNRWKNDIPPNGWSGDMSLITDSWFDKYFDYKDQRILLTVRDPTGRNDRYGRTIHSSCHGVQTHILCYCYDVSNPKSLTDLLTWDKRFWNKGITLPRGGLFKVLVGCKCELDDQCSKDDLQKVMTELDIDKHLKVSAQNDINIDVLFDGLVKECADYLNQRAMYPFCL